MRRCSQQRHKRGRRRRSLKAYTARTRNQTSLQTMNMFEDPANAFIRQVPRVVGVGVSGAPGGEKDEVCANAGLVKIEAVLR
jgi:hypothetical protein